MSCSTKPRIGDIIDPDFHLGVTKVITLRIGSDWFAIDLIPVKRLASFWGFNPKRWIRLLSIFPCFALSMSSAFAFKISSCRASSALAILFKISSRLCSLNNHQSESCSNPRKKHHLNLITVDIARLQWSFAFLIWNDFHYSSCQPKWAVMKIVPTFLIPDTNSAIMIILWTALAFRVDH